MTHGIYNLYIYTLTSQNISFALLLELFIGLLAVGLQEGIFFICGDILLTEFKETRKSSISFFIRFCSFSRRKIFFFGVPLVSDNWTYSAVHFSSAAFIFIDTGLSDPFLIGFDRFLLFPFAALAFIAIRFASFILPAAFSGCCCC